LLGFERGVLEENIQSAAIVKMLTEAGDKLLRRIEMVLCSLLFQTVNGR